MKNPVIVLLTLALPCTAIIAQDEATLPYMPPDQADGPWENIHKVAPVYPRRALTRREEGCATVGYVIESDGTTSAHRLIATYPSERFAEPSIDAAKQFTYAPSDSNPGRDPVYTTNVFTYQLGRGDDTNERVRKALVEICEGAAEELLGVEDSEEASDGS